MGQETTCESGQNQVPLVQNDRLSDCAKKIMNLLSEDGDMCLTYQKICEYFDKKTSTKTISEPLLIAITGLHISLCADSCKEYDKLVDEITSLYGAIFQMETDFGDLNEENKRLRWRLHKTIEDVGRESESLERHESLLRQYEAEAIVAKETVVSVSEERRRTVDSLKLSHAHEVTTLQTKHQHTITELQMAFASKEDDLTCQISSLKETLAQVEEAHTLELMKLRLQREEAQISQVPVLHTMNCATAESSPILDQQYWQEQFRKTIHKKDEEIRQLKHEREQLLNDIARSKSTKRRRC
eukprot:Clim_evm28s128 gene=Clim_evmTU28s128